jgi:hypothetical protein
MTQRIPAVSHGTSAYKVVPRVCDHLTSTAIVITPLGSRSMSPRVGTRASVTVTSKDRAQAGTLYKDQRQAVTYPIGFLLVGLDRIDPVLGAHPAVQLSKNGGAWAPAVGTVSAVGKGWYQLTPAPADLNVPGEVILMATAPGAVTSWAKFDVVSYDTFANITLTPTELAALADVTLTRSFASAASVAARSVIQAVKALWSWKTAPASPLTIVNADSTTAWQANVVTDPTIKPIRGMTPTTTP